MGTVEAVARTRPQVLAGGGVSGKVGAHMGSNEGARGAAVGVFPAVIGNQGEPYKTYISDRKPEKT